MKPSINHRTAEFKLNSSIIPNIKLDQVVGHYLLKTATTEDELRSAFKLRYDVFYREFAGFKIDDTIEYLDIDEHDNLCDHLIVKDLRTSDVIACYRLLSSKNKPKKRAFYSESEFIIDEFVNTDESKLELGRACVHKSYRRGTVVQLLWKGIVEYAKKSDTRYMFGCSSVSHDQFSFIPEILNELSLKDKFISEWQLDVCEKYKCDIQQLDTRIFAQVRPHASLMQVYLKAGAKIGRKLAYDRSLNCVDLFTVLDFNELPLAFKRGLSDY